MVAPRIPLAKRLVPKIDFYGENYALTFDGEPCWIWQAAFRRQYGGISANGVFSVAHRVTYELERGPIPDGMQLDHLCRTRPCVNPRHLEIVTPRTNVLRGVGTSAVNARKSHCIHDHEFSAANTYTHRGKRSCRQCAAARMRVKRAAA